MFCQFILNYQILIISMNLTTKRQVNAAKCLNDQQSSYTMMPNEMNSRDEINDTTAYKGFSVKFNLHKNYKFKDLRNSFNVIVNSAQKDKAHMLNLDANISKLSQMQEKSKATDESQSLQDTQPSWIKESNSKESVRKMDDNNIKIQNR